MAKKDKKYFKIQGKQDMRSSERLMQQLLLLFFGIALFLTPYFKGLFFEREFLIFLIIFSLLFLSGISLVVKRERELLLLKTPLDLFVFLFVIVYLLASISPANLREAVVVMLRATTYFFVYWFCAHVLREKKEIHYIIWVIIAAGAGVSLVGIGSALGTLDVNGAWIGNRISSTLQYPNTLAAYLMTINMLGLGLWSYYKKLYLKLLMAVANYMFVLAILGTDSRGAWLIYPIAWGILWVALPGMYKWQTLMNSILSIGVALIASTKVLPAAIAGQSQQGWLWFFGGIVIISIGQLAVTRLVPVVSNIGNKKLISSALGALLLISIVGGLGIAKSNSPGLQSLATKIVPQTVMARMQAIDAEQHSVVERFIFYKDALKIVKDNPILGTGGGGWNAVYRSYQDHLYYTTEVHSHFLQVWVETGIIGFMIFIGIWLSFLVSVFICCRREKDDSKKIIAISIGASAVALGLHSMIDFNLSLSAVAILLWSFFGLSQGWTRLIQSDHTNEEEGFWIERLNKYLKAIGYKTGVTIAVVALILTTSLLIAQGMASKAVLAIQQGELELAEEYFNKARRLDPFNASYLIDMAQLYHYRGQTTGVDEELKEAINLGEKAISREPYNPKIRLLHAQHLLTAREIEKFIKESETILALFPKNRDSYENLADDYLTAIKYFLKNDNEELAAKYISKLLDVPIMMDETWNQVSEEGLKTWIHGPKLDELSPMLQMYLGQGHVLRGDIDKAKDYLESVVILNEEIEAEAIAWQALAALKDDDLFKVEELLEQLQEIDQNALQHFVEWRDLI